MKKCMSIALIGVLFTLLAACTKSVQNMSEPVTGSTTSQVSTSVNDSVNKPAVVIEFKDKALEAAVRKAMNKPQGDITIEKASQVVSLNLGNESFDDMNTKNGGIKDISALKYFEGLTELNLAFNNVSDLTPLSKLTKLETLDISGTLVEDLLPLKDSQSIKCLIFCWLHGDSGTPKGIGSLDALAGLQSLEQIDAKNAGIKDVSALAGLPKLWEVQLNDNQIADITPLGNVKTLKVLLLAGNPIKNYSLLKDIYPKLEGKDFEIK